MLVALLRAFGQLGDPAVRRVLWLSAGAALAVLVGLTVAAGWGLSHLQLTGWTWLDWTLDLLGGLGTVVLAVVLFPATAGVITGFLLDDVAEAVERRHYPALGAARPQGLAEVTGATLRFLAVMVLANLIGLVLVYFVPVLNLVAFYAINGYLLGREYFELVALRRVDGMVMRILRRRFSLRVFTAGVVIAVLLTVPVLNLLVPVVATAFMVHVFHGLSGNRPSRAGDPGML